MTTKVNRTPSSVGEVHFVSGAGAPYSKCANTLVVMADPEHPILIECGSDNELGYDRLKRNLGYLGIKMCDIDEVLATHGHWDHYSGIRRLRQESDAKLFVPTEDIAAVEAGDDELTAASFFRQEAYPAKVDGEVGDNFRREIGDVTIEAIKMRLHTAGSVCYKITQPGSTIIVGGDDFYGYYFQTPGRNIEEDIEIGKESIRHLRQLDIDFITMGHMVPYFMDDAATRLEEMERQLGSFDVAKELSEYDGPLRPAHINPWRKVRGQSYLY